MFSAKRLLGQRRASANTVASYQDAYDLHLRFGHETLRKAPQVLELEDLDARLIGDFVAWLENGRVCGIQTRDTRVAAIRALLYAFFEYPEHAGLTHCVLVILPMRTEMAIVAYLTETETNALINSPIATTSRGHRDKVPLLVAVVTGLRVSELVNLTVADGELRASSYRLVRGKERKERITPLSAQARRQLKDGFNEPNPSTPDPIFPGSKSSRFTRDRVAKMLSRQVT